ncbi:hypothetical protein J5J10_01615 [Ciceribacter sp. L1K23]|uniref:hypothetical protein n=1 Tax=unclassified Ciceribacter TaxID=2628820 RepID=UPI001ABEDB78|nr:MULTISPECIES: hypothetical protein [unclassified Ciceribacter]MBO3761669.1 hypothetical protein [Ciceribacter sp. L1K22]MBR0554365.1 hypothetical protein [Ciceribacter sp. L1K23]
MASSRTPQIERSRGEPIRASIDEMVRDPVFRGVIDYLANSFVTTHMNAPRQSAIFATQQRWLLSHVALGEYFRSLAAGKAGITRTGFGNLALRNAIASRNTAYAFFDEALKYGMISTTADGDSAAPTPQTLALLSQWYEIHLHALDLFDDGGRAVHFQAEPLALLSRMGPEVAGGLVSNPDIRAPGPLYTIFTWSDIGGLLMDRLISGIDWQVRPSHGGYLTDVSSISYLARNFGLSRAHTSRKLSAAESIGGIGWSGPRGYSRIWISADFYAEYARAHARKLLIVDAAYWAAVNS